MVNSLRPLDSASDWSISFDSTSDWLTQVPKNKRRKDWNDSVDLAEEMVLLTQEERFWKMILIEEKFDLGAFHFHDDRVTEGLQTATISHFNHPRSSSRLVVLVMIK